MTKHKKRPAGKRETIRDIEFRTGSGNVFKDLGLPNAEERFAKLKLAMQINEIITTNGWTQKTAAAKLGTKQPEISSLKRGRLHSITYDRLLGWLKLLGYSVTIEVEQSADPHLEVAIPL